MKPTNEKLQAALDWISPLLPDNAPDGHPSKTLVSALKFTMAANEPSKDVVRAGIHTKPQSFGTLEGDIFKAMTAKIWEEIE